jgi:hypothetical protein
MYCTVLSAGFLLSYIWTHPWRLGFISQTDHLGQGNGWNSVSYRPLIPP